MNPKKIINFGYGGISCPCCTPHNTRKKNKNYSKRRFRKHLGNQQTLEEEEYLNYEIDRNNLEGRDAVEYSSVYTQNYAAAS